MKKSFLILLVYLFSFIFGLPLTIFALLIVTLISFIFGAIHLLLISILFIIFYIPSVVLFIITFRKNLWKQWRFWILSLLIPLLFLVIFDVVFPYTQNNRAKKYESLFYTNIGFSSFKDIYRVKDDENSTKFISTLEKISVQTIDSLDIFVSYLNDLYNYYDSILKNKSKIANIVKPFTALMDSFYKYDNLQYVNLEDYKDSIFSIPLMPFSKINVFVNANMLDALINAGNNENKLFEKFEKIWKFSNLISYDLFLLNGMVSLLIKNNIVDHIIYLLKNDRIKNHKLLDSFVNKIYEESENNSIIIPSKEKFKDGKIKWISPVYLETYAVSKYFDKALNSFIKNPSMMFPYDSLLPTNNFLILPIIISAFPFYNSIYYVNKPEIYRLNLKIYPQKFNHWKDFKDYFIKERFSEKFEKIYSERKYNYTHYSLTPVFIIAPTKIIKKELLLKTKINLLKSYLDFTKNEKDWNKSDPFSLDKFVYVSTGNTTILYSFGENLKDDVGKEDDISIEWNNKNKKLINLNIKSD